MALGAQVSGATGGLGDRLVGELEELDDDPQVAGVEPVAVRVDRLGEGLVERPQLGAALGATGAR